MVDDGAAPLAVSGMPRCSLITNHARVLLAIAEDPSRTVTDIAYGAGITERSAFRILADLQQAGYLQRTKRGRRNLYQLAEPAALPGQIETDSSIRELAAVLAPRTD